MGAVVALDSLFNGGRVWKGRPAVPPASVHPTGLAALDAVLPTGGWPESALSEILMAKDGVGELRVGKIDAYVIWVRGRSDLEAADWERIGETLHQRWLEAEDATDRHKLGDSLLRVYSRYARDSKELPFMRSRIT